MGAKILIAAMLAILVGAIYVGYAGWTHGEDPDMPASAYLALALGTLFSIAVGSGLMALVFYSSRKGYDDAADRPGKRKVE